MPSDLVPTAGSEQWPRHLCARSPGRGGLQVLTQKSVAASGCLHSKNHILLCIMHTYIFGPNFQEKEPFILIL